MESITQAPCAYKCIGETGIFTIEQGSAKNKKNLALSEGGIGFLQNSPKVSIPKSCRLISKGVSGFFRLTKLILKRLYLECLYEIQKFSDIITGWTVRSVLLFNVAINSPYHSLLSIG